MVQMNNDPVHVLVVEDDPVSQAVVVAQVKSQGYVVLTASNGLEALTILQHHDVRIVISDWNMPEMNGLELCHAIRCQPSGAFIFFIMFTAQSEETRLVDAFNAGVNDFLSKPLHFNELLARLSNAARTVRLHHELERGRLRAIELNQELHAMNRRLEQLSLTDELTGLNNRRSAFAKLSEYWAIAQRHAQPLTCAVLDLDFFKRINDTHGHAVGDEVLRQTADALRRNVRTTDWVFRIGGEEFLMIFLHETAQGAAICAQRCRRSVENLKIHVGDSVVTTSISIGLAQMGPHLLDPVAFFTAADQAMYQAKRSGRNTVCIADPHRPSTAPPAAPTLAMTP